MRVYRLAGTVVGTEDASFMEMLGIEFISAKMVHDILQEAGGEDIVFNLNSAGGSVIAGSEIYTMLSTYSGHITVNITGLSASIASVFMLGADEVNIAHQAKIMIHNPSVMVSDNVEVSDLDKIKNMLTSTEKSLAKVYTKKTGIPENEILDMMLRETWLTSDEALELGFVDNIFADGSETSGLAEDLVAMVHTADEQLEVIKELKNLRGTPMNKSLLEKIKGIINGVEDAENAADTTIDGQVVNPEEAPEEAVEASENVPTEEVKEPTEEAVETVEEDSEDTTELMEKAISEIETLRDENKELKEKVQKLEEEKNSLDSSNKELEAKNQRSLDVVNKLNELLNSEEANIVAVSQTTKDNMPVGYKGIRGGLK